MIKIEMKPSTSRSAIEAKIQADFGTTPNITICSRSRVAMTIDAPLTAAQVGQLKASLLETMPGWEVNTKTIGKEVK